MSDNTSSSRLNLNTDEDIQSMSSSNSSKASLMNAKLNIRRLGKKEHLTEGEKIRLSSAKRLVELHEASKGSGCSVASEHNSLVNDMKEVIMENVESKSNCESDTFLQINHAFQVVKNLGDRNVNLLNEEEKISLTNARKTIFKWCQPSENITQTAGKNLNTIKLNKLQPNISSNLATAGEMEVSIDESPNSSTAKVDKIVDNSESKLDVINTIRTHDLTNPSALALADAEMEKVKLMNKPPSSFTFSWVRQGLNLNSTPLTSSQQAENGSLNPESDEPGCSKRDRSKDTYSPDITILKNLKLREAGTFITMAA